MSEAIDLLNKIIAKGGEAAKTAQQNLDSIKKYQQQKAEYEKYQKEVEEYNRQMEDYNKRINQLKQVGN